MLVADQSAMVRRSVSHENGHDLRNVVAPHL